MPIAFNTYISGTAGFLKFENGCTMNTIIYKCVLSTHQRQRGPMAQMKVVTIVTLRLWVQVMIPVKRNQLYLSLFHISAPCMEDCWQREAWTKTIYSQTQMLDGHICHIFSDAACGFL